MITKASQRKSMAAMALLSLFSGINIASGQDAKMLSLEEAIRLSLSNSKQLKMSQASIDAATASLKQNKEKRLPDVSASGSYLRVSKPTIALLSSFGSSSGSGGSGGEESTSKSPDVKEAMYAMANASLPLFDGFKTRAAIESARYLETAAKLDAEHDRQAVIQNTIAAFTNLYKAKAAVGLVEENLKQAHQRSEDFSNLEKNGLLARNDLLKAQLQESNIQLSLLDAQSDYKIASINMDLMLGLPDGTVLEPDTNSFKLRTEDRTLEAWLQTALEQRPDMKALEQREASGLANIRSEKGGYFPTVRLTGGYLALNVPNAIRITDAWNAGLGVSYSISSLWKTSTAVALAKARTDQTRASRELLADNVRIQINRAYEDYLLSVKKIEVYGKALEQARENYRIVKNKHDNSLATTTDLLDADVQQLQARLNYVNAKADIIVAYNQLLQSAGILNDKQ